MSIIDGVTVDPALTQGNAAKDKVGKLSYQCVPQFVFDYASCTSIENSFLAYMATGSTLFLYGVLRHFSPFDIMLRVQSVREYGITKYKDPDNWKKVPIADLRDAAMRHYAASCHELHDKESHLPHLSHLLCNIVFILSLTDQQNGV